MALREAWESLTRRGLPVGAVIAKGSEVMAKGRNRVYDPPGGPDPLQGTPLAHAEMNALASTGLEDELAECSVWTTHSPCSLCRAAIEFVGLAATHYLANDLSDDEGPSPEVTTDPESSLWVCVANMMFIHNVAWVAGKDTLTVARGERLEPEITSLALTVLAEQSFIRVANDGGGLLDGLHATWDQVLDTDQRRTTPA